MLVLTGICDELWLSDEAGNKMVCLSQATGIERVGSVLQVDTADGKRKNFELAEEYNGQSARDIMSDLSTKSLTDSLKALYNTQ